MSENKMKMVLGECPFKPSVNKMTTKQRAYRESRFVSNPDELQKQF